MAKRETVEEVIKRVVERINERQRRFGTFIDPRDGQVYNTVRIGDQIWMAENLNYGEMTTDDELVPGKKWCYDNDESNCEDGYGGLYTWEVAKKSCPPGWHLPTDEEWTNFIYFTQDELAKHCLETWDWVKDFEFEEGEEVDADFFGNYFGDDAFNQNVITKSYRREEEWKGSRRSRFDELFGSSDEKENYIDLFGFHAVPAGMRSSADGEFKGRFGEWYELFTNWFSADGFGEDKKTHSDHGFGLSGSDWSWRRDDDYSVKDGFSVRCVKDAEPAAKPKKTVVALSKKAHKKTTAKKATPKKAAPKKAATGKTSKSKARKG